MQVHTVNASAGEFNAVVILAALAFAGLGFLLSASGLISILVSGGTRRGLPYALGGLALNGLALVGGALFALLGASVPEGGPARIMELDRQEVFKRHGRPRIPTPWPVPATVEPQKSGAVVIPDDAFRGLWPDEKEQAGAPFRVKGSTCSSTPSVIDNYLSMAGVVADMGTRFVDGGCLKLESSKFRVYAFRLAGKGRLIQVPDEAGVRTVAVLERGDLRVVVLCSSPAMEKDPEFIEIVGYFQRRLASAAPVEPRER